MVRFEELPKKVSTYCCVLKAPMLKCRNSDGDFLKFQTVWLNSIVFELARGAAVGVAAVV